MSKRPAHVKPPAYLAKNTPVPRPGPLTPPPADPDDRDPTRYGDWELKGIAVDF